MSDQTTDPSSENKTQTSEKLTLLDHRRQQRDEAVQETLAMCEVLRKVVDMNYADLHARIRDVLTAVQRAERAAAQVADLEDVEKYGPNGGRG